MTTCNASCGLTSGFYQEAWSNVCSMVPKKNGMVSLLSTMEIFTMEIFSALWEFNVDISFTLCINL